MEAQMRTIAILAGLVALASVSVQAAPLPPAKAAPVELDTAPPIELVRQGCGWVGTASTDATVGVLALGSLRSELVRVGAFLPPS